METGLTGKWTMEKEENIEMLAKEIKAMDCPLMIDAGMPGKMTMDIIQTGKCFKITCCKMDKTICDMTFTIGKEWKWEKGTMMPTLEGTKLIMIWKGCGKDMTSKMEVKASMMMEVMTSGSITANRQWMRM